MGIIIIVIYSEICICEGEIKRKVIRRLVCGLCWVGGDYGV